MKSLPWTHKGLAAVLFGLVSVIGADGSQAGEFYKDKTVTLIVPNSPAGHMSQYARMIAPHLEKSLGAKEVRIENHPGAGGLKGANMVWHSEPDGLTISFASIPTLILAELANSPGVQFKAEELTYLGRAASEPRVLTVGPKSPIKTIEDVVNLDRPFIYASQGTDEDFYAMALVGDALGFDLKMITGYEGDADTNLAVIKGDADGQMASWTGSMVPIKAGDKRPILTMGEKRFPGFPEVTAIMEVVPESGKDLARAIINIQDLHRGFYGPPGMDAQAAKEMREAITAALASEELIADSKERQLPLDPLDGATAQERVREIFATSDKIRPVLAKALESIK